MKRFGKFREVCNLGFRITGRPNESFCSEARILRQLCVKRSHNPYRHSAAAQTSRYGKSIEISSKDQCSCVCAHLRRPQKLFVLSLKNYPTSAVIVSTTGI